MSDPAAPQSGPSGLPRAGRRTQDVAGHWVLARLGKRVLRPGGRRLSHQLLLDVDPEARDVVEFAPGIGRTAAEIVALAPLSYIGVEEDPDAAALTEAVVGEAGRVVRADAAATGLPDASVDVVIGEAMLTMQGAAGKAAILGEARRILRREGRYAIHELALEPDALDEADKTTIRRALARSIKVNARPLTGEEWRTLLEENGFAIESVRYAPMALLQPRRLVADEGLGRALRFVVNVLRDADGRRRVLDMRATFRRYRRNLAAIAIVAVRKERVTSWTSKDVQETSRILVPDRAAGTAGGWWRGSVRRTPATRTVKPASRRSGC